MTTAVGYIRVSTAEQVGGFGLDAQEAAIRAYCQANGLRLVAVYRDEGISGSNGLEGRVGLAEAFAGLAAGRASCLVVYRLDRLARDLVLAETLVQRLRDQGTPVRSASEPDLDTDTDDPTKVLVRQVLGAISQYERQVIRGRMLAGKAAKAARGGYVGGRPRFGWRAEGGQLVADEAEQAVVRRARELRGRGLSLRAIGAQLGASGVSPRGGGRWGPTQVSRILA